MREVVRNFNKLAKNLKAQETPESMAYLRILGSELGYIKANELKEYANWAFMYASIMTYDMPMQVRTFIHYVKYHFTFSLVLMSICLLYCVCICTCSICI